MTASTHATPTPAGASPRGGSLRSAYFVRAMGEFVASHLSALRAVVQHVQSLAHSNQRCRYLLTYAHAVLARAECGGLRGPRSATDFMNACWLCMAVSEVDEGRSGEAFFALYLHAPDDDAEESTGFPGIGTPDALTLGELWAAPSRIDLIPPTALARLDAHSATRADKDPTNAGVWMTEGMPVSAGIDMLKSCLDDAHRRGAAGVEVLGELYWAFMACRHVCDVFPGLNDLADYEGIRNEV